MEALAIAISGNHSILSEYDSENLPSPLFLTSASSDHSRLPAAAAAFVGGL